MAKKKTSVQKVDQNKGAKDSYVFKDPSESLLGKIVIGLIIFGTIAIILIGAVIAVINFFS